MTDRPILFSGPMVRALLTKTQTRRTAGLDVVNLSPDAWDDVRCFGDVWSFRGERALTEELVRCPYGQAGDRLWVRERMRRIGAVLDESDRPTLLDIKYEADDEIRLAVPFPKRLKGVPKHGQCLAYGGYREASRTTLKITGVRVERLQTISAADAIAEGIDDTWRANLWPLTWDHGPHEFLPVGVTPPTATPDQRAVAWYGALWAGINGKDSWDANPWVWVIEFKRVAA